MKAKKSLFLVVLTLALLAVALVLPAAAYGKCLKEPPANKPVNWVSVDTNNRFPDSNFPDLMSRGGTEANVQQLADGTLRGEVTVKVLREFWPNEDGTPTLFRYVVKTRAFTSPDWWDYAPPGLAHANFFFAAEENWPADLGPAPPWWSDCEGAAVADFVAYVPISEYKNPPPWVGLYTMPPWEDTPSIPYRFMFIDSGKRGKADVMLNWLFVGDPPMTPWKPTVWTVPIQTGNILVHVGK